MRRENSNYPNRCVPDLLSYLTANPVEPPKLWVTGTAAQITEARKRLQTSLNEALRCAPAGTEALEMMLTHTSKAAGLCRLAAKLGIDFSQVIAVGDSDNDVEMIREAGLGVAMGNAPADIRQMAGFVTRTNAEHGVAYVVEKFLPV